MLLIPCTFKGTHIGVIILLSCIFSGSLQGIVMELLVIEAMRGC
jgi:hypothetical protein